MTADYVERNVRLRLDNNGSGSHDASRVVLVRLGGAPPPTFAASILVTSPMDMDGQTSDATAVAQERIVDELAATWTAPGTLAVFVAGSRTTPETGLPDEWEDETFWRSRVDVVLVWPVINPHVLTSLLDRIARGRTPGWVVLGVPTTSSLTGTAFLADDAAPLVGKHLPQGHVAATTTACARIALDLIGTGADRTGGQRHVPLPVWTFPPFQQWLTSQQDAGNWVQAGRVEWVHHSGPGGGVFLVGFKPELVVSSEQERVKDIELVVIRPPIDAVVAFLRDPNDIWDSEVVIVGEMRSAAMTSDGRVHEIPGGSGANVMSPVDNAVSELFQETGIAVESERVHFLHGSQPLASLTAVTYNICWAELTDAEMKRFRADRRTHGVAEESERTYCEPGWTFGTVVVNPEFDLATRGAVAAIARTLATVPAASPTALADEEN